MSMAAGEKFGRAKNGSRLLRGAAHQSAATAGLPALGESLPQRGKETGLPQHPPEEEKEQDLGSNLFLGDVALLSGILRFSLCRPLRKNKWF